jgi:hypothetical protein
MLLLTMMEKLHFKNIFSFSVIGLCIFFIGMLFFIAILDTVTGNSLDTAEYCSNYGYLVSPDCWYLNK